MYVSARVFTRSSARVHVFVSAKPWNTVSCEALLWAEMGDETACHWSYVTETCAEYWERIHYDTSSFLNMQRCSGIIRLHELLFIVWPRNTHFAAEPYVWVYWASTPRYNLNKTVRESNLIRNRNKQNKIIGVQKCVRVVSSRNVVILLSCSSCYFFLHVFCWSYRCYI